MALPVSSQGYIPNPLTAIRAEQAGFEMGTKMSPFANFLEGAFGGFEKTLDFANTIQEMELRPQKIEQENRVIDQRDRALDLQEDEQIRLEDQMQLNEDFRREELGFRRDNAAFENDLKRARATKLVSDASRRSQGQSQNNIVDGAISSLVVDGDISPLDAILADKQNPRTRSQMLERLIKDPIGQSAVEKIEDSLSTGQFDPSTRQRMESMLQTLSYGKNISSAREIAASGQSVILSTVGALPQPGTEVKMRPVRNSGTLEKFEIFEKLPSGGSRSLGTYVPGDLKEQQSVFAALNAHNRVSQMQRAAQEDIRRSTEKVAESRAAESTSLKAQPDVPAKISRTPASRVGLRGKTPELTGDVTGTTTSTTITSPQNKRQTAARERLLNLAGNDDEEETQAESGGATGQW